MSTSPEEAGALLGFIGQVIGMDGAASAKITEAKFGWRATQVGLTGDLEKGTYFDEVNQ